MPETVPGLVDQCGACERLIGLWASIEANFVGTTNIVLYLGVAGIGEVPVLVMGFVLHGQMDGRLNIRAYLEKGLTSFIRPRVIVTMQFISESSPKHPSSSISESSACISEQ